MRLLVLSVEWAALSRHRYPTFIDAVRDIDDALCMISLFANLPSNPRIPPSLIENCTRLSNEWQLYVMRSQSLRKIFLSIKGVYYQAEVMGQTITWLVPYMFTQNVSIFYRAYFTPYRLVLQIPADVDVRVMLTFLELYQTLLGFVFFKLYTDIGLVYPPPLDAVKDDGAAGVGAYSLQERNILHAGSETNGVASKEVVDVTGKLISGKDVRKTIKSIEAAQGGVLKMAPESQPESQPEAAPEEEEEFVAQPSTSNVVSSNLPTLKSLTELPSSVNTLLFAPYTFFLSRETPRPLLEFVIRSFGGRVGWTPSQGGGSPVQEDDEAITHVIVDRPSQAPVPLQDSDQATSQMAEDSNSARELRRRRKYVQPQWVVDCVNKGTVLLEGPYERGKTLPPHLSPFGGAEGAYDPEETTGHDDPEEEVDEEECEDEENVTIPIADPEDPSAIRAAELEAEAAGMDFGTFERAIKKQKKIRQTVPADVYVISVLFSATTLMNVTIDWIGKVT